MNRRQKNKLIFIIALFVILSMASGLILYALKQNINLFFTPTELAKAQVSPDQSIRIGGYVKKNSVHYDASGKHVNFVVTDHQHDIQVKFDGVLPNLFREGQVVIATGKLNSDRDLLADQVLAKHDEKYMPKQLAKDLQRGKINAS